jgi:hypothetical protein
MFGVWSWRHLAFFDRSNDEGVYLMQARLLGSGFALYRDMPSLQPPLMLAFLRAAFDLFGEAVQTGRTALLVVNCLALVAVGAIARVLRGWSAAFAAMGFLILSPLFFSLARAVMSSLPATALAACSVAAALGYRTIPRYGRALFLAAVSGLLFGLGLVVKPIALPLVVPIVILGLGRRYAAGGPADVRAPWSALAAAPLALTRRPTCRNCCSGWPKATSGWPPWAPSESPMLSSAPIGATAGRAHGGR